MRVVLSLSVLSLAGRSLGACDDDAPQHAVCTQLCDDSDPCTDDHCDPATDTCVFVPRDAVHACRTDAHCDDGITCTVDTCELDFCGLERCHFDTVACQGCFVSSDCPRDEDPCTVDLCRGGFCTYEPAARCEDRRCDPDGPLEPGQRRFAGVAAPAESCSCNCTTDLLIDEQALLTDPPAHCTASCIGEERTLECTPLKANLEWIVFARAVDDDDMHWCLAPSALLEPHTWDVSIALPSQSPVRCKGQTTKTDGQLLFGLTCEPCRECVRVPGTGFSNPLVVGAFASSTSMPFDDPFLGLRTFIWQLYPSATGFVGTVSSSDDQGFEPIDGTVTLTLRGLP